MAVTRTSRSVQFTAAADALAQPVKIKEVHVIAEGATAGDQALLRDAPNGSIIADFRVPGTDGTWIAAQPCAWYQGLYVDTLDANLTIVVTTL